MRLRNDGGLIAMAYEFIRKKSQLSITAFGRSGRREKEDFIGSIASNNNKEI